MKKTLIATALSMIFLTQASVSFAESQSFKFVVVIPPMIQMAADITQSRMDQTLALNDSKATQMVQEQTMIRGMETIQVRSIVAL